VTERIKWEPSKESRMQTLVDNVVSHFTGDPFALVLALLGALFVGGASAAFGYLTLGAVADLLTPNLSTESPPRADR